MNRVQLINLVTARTELRRADVALVMDATFETIMDEVVKGKKVSIMGFGVFEARERSARQGTDPRNGETISIPAKLVPFFFASKIFKESVWSQE